MADDRSYSKDKSRSRDSLSHSNDDSSGWKERSSSSSKSKYHCYQLPKDRNYASPGSSSCYKLSNSPTSTPRSSSHKQSRWSESSSPYSPRERRHSEDMSKTGLSMNPESRRSESSSPYLPRERSHSEDMSNSSTPNSHRERKYSEGSLLVRHQKKLAVLKSSENRKVGGEYSDNEVPILNSILKRKRSDDEDEDFSPRKKRESESSVVFRSSPVVESPARSRLSLPSTSCHSYSSDRRSSLPSANTPIRTNFNRRTDQTPYASPLYKRVGTRLPYYDASGLNDLESESGFIDSHCHLDFLVDRQRYSGTWAQYKEDNVFPRCYKGCLAVFCNPHTFCKRYKWGPFLDVDGVWASFGCHPHNASDYNDDVERYLLQALDHPKVRALGEIGLDYSNRNNCMKEAQFSAFRKQLKIALQRKLPVVIHCREANEDGMRIIKEILPSDYTIHLHCFTDSWEWAKVWLGTFPNLFIGITNVVTFPSASSVHEVVQHIPLNRLLLETDAPYFVPRKTSAKHSHPGMAIHVAAQIAAIRNTSIEEVLRNARNSTKRVYNI